ncbi:major facilitator superfamily domain-containing protein [Xylogone sp. PMI_703]|nr:major facilitator superfamily domain-containing protein [Xylogone sp. PMI_703]
MDQEKSVVEDVTPVDSTPQHVDRFQRVFRSTLLQVVIVGLVSFMNPGIWNALNSLGAGGEETPFLVNAANAITFGIMIIGCTLGGVIANKIGLKWALVLGTLGYPFYSASLYTNNRYGVKWFVLFGAVTCGLSASMLWASEAAIALGYPEHKKRGRYVGIWLGIRGCGSLIGGAINLALNVKDTKTGKVGYTTYLVLIAIQCCGLPLALLLSPPEKVIRDDGTKVPRIKHTTWLTEGKAVWKLIRSRRILLLIPVFIVGNWGSVYTGNYFATYFSVRSRALGSFLTAIAGISGDLLTGLALDYKPWSRSLRAKVIWIWLVCIILSLWIWQTTNQVLYDRTVPKFDWDTSGFGRAFAPYILFNFTSESLNTYLYWTMGTLDDGVGTLARTTGLLRTFESVGSTFAFVTGAKHWKYINMLILSFSLFVFQIPFTTFAAWNVPNQPFKNEETDSQLSDSPDEDSVDKTTDVGELKV